MNMDELKKKKEKLMNMRTNLQKELNEINEQILNVDFKIIQECGKTTGHEFVTERELRPPPLPPLSVPPIQATFKANFGGKVWRKSGLGGGVSGGM